MGGFAAHVRSSSGVPPLHHRRIAWSPPSPVQRKLRNARSNLDVHCMATIIATMRGNACGVVAASRGRIVEGRRLSRRVTWCMDKRKVDVRARPNRQEDAASKESLEAFFLGRALAEMVVEQVGEVVGETLSQVGTLVAERDERLVQFRKDVEERAREEMARSIEVTTPVERNSEPERPPLDLDGAIEELRNEIDQARKQLEEVRALDAKESDGV